MQRKRPEIIFENQDFIVLNKPSGLLSIPDREGKEVSLKKILKDEYGEIFTVHRLDQDTSGLIVFAKNQAAHKMLSRLFEERTVEKIYTGIVIGTLTEKKGSIDAPIAENMHKAGAMLVHNRGKHATTDYEVLEEFGLFSFARFQIHTGRTHQIRVHMQHIGHPIVCDKIYGNAQPVFLSSFKKKFKLSKFAEEERPVLSRLALHASQLSFTGTNGTARHFEAPLPKDMSALLQQLRKWAH
ncbi:MAG: RluA family pseudouridine synthase [Bacteroidetes bacterium]|nr:RluA family pseudouridine synthase [Bacteroidota bacterium]MBS1974397.1 RluA family pseudouridine synthase [Bacteroidota bacterium]